MNTLNTIYDDVDENSMPYILFTVGKNVYAISSEFAKSIERLGEITTITKAEPNVRGGLIYQNEFIHLVDMRKVFGLDSQVDEFEKNVKPEQRIKDHEYWVSELEKSVHDHTEFSLTDDPHKCAFGKWFYSFKTDNNVLKHQLNAIEGPHEAVHNTAKVVRNLMKTGKEQEAKAAINEMRRSHFKKTLGILSSLRDVVEESLKELYIVINSNGGTKGIIVDSIVGVEHLESTFPIDDSMQGSKHMECLGRRKNSDTIVIVLNNSI